MRLTQYWYGVFIFFMEGQILRFAYWINLQHGSHPGEVNVSDAFGALSNSVQ